MGDAVVLPENFLAGYPAEDLVLKPAFQDACRAAVEELARDTADGGPALLVGLPYREGDSLLIPTLCLMAAVSRPSATNVTCPITACSMKSASSMPARCRGRWCCAACASVFRSARTSGARRFVECLAETGAEMLIVPNGSPYWRDKDDERINIAVARVTDLACAGLCQRGGRAGRTGVRWRFLRAQC